jgi:predicted RNA-binding protein YlxR (DUF448 family)
MIARTVTHAAERTCLGCRKRDARTALVRLVADGDRVVVDTGLCRPGRGAWVHRDPRCAKRLTLGAIERGLKRKLSEDSICSLQLVTGTPER